MSEHQPPLIDVPAQVMPTRSAEGEYTLERVLARRPDTVRIARGLLADQASVLDTARICRMSPHTVMAIKARMAQESGVDPADEERASLAETLRRGALLAAGEIVDRLQTQTGRQAESTRDLALAIGVMVPQSLAVDGASAVRAQDIGPTPADILRDMRDISGAVVIGPSRAPAQGAAGTGQGAENQDTPPAELHGQGESAQVSHQQEHAS